jgi:4-aminobutyrate aminotransferase
MSDVDTYRPEPSLYERDAAVVAGIEKLRFFPLAVVEGEGSWLVEEGGRRLLDLSATWTASGLGHGHPAVTEAVTRALRKPAGAGGLSAVHPDSVGFAEELLALTPGVGERRVYFGHTGSDANDVVLRACRHATGWRRIVTFQHSYHGGVGVAMGVSGVHIDAGADAEPGLYLATYPNPFRPHAHGPDPVEASVAASLAEIERELSRGDVACVMVEPILSDGGLVVPPRGFLRRLHELCRRHDVPLACDEVKMGLGRPGVLHAFQLDDVVPDIITFGKAIGGGLPLSAAVGPSEILNGPEASALLTTAGNPICTAAGRAVLRTLIAEDLPGRAAASGERLMAGLRKLQEELPVIGDVRGHRLAIGLELVTDRETNTPDRRAAQHVVYRAWQLGAVVFYVGGNVLEITPPLVINNHEVDLAVDILGSAISDAAAGKAPHALVAPFAGW